jgi:hypothetical protein
MSNAPKRPLRGAWWTPEQTEAALGARQQAADAAMAGLDPIAGALHMRAEVPAELDGLDAGAIRKLSMASYAEIRRRAGLPDIDPYADTYSAYEPPTPQAAVSAPEAVRANADVPDFASMSMAAYAQFRQEAGIGQSRSQGIGILNSGASRADADAARVQASRHGLSNASVTMPPRLEGRTVLRQDDLRDTRSAAQRFGTPGNSYQPW